MVVQSVCRQPYDVLRIVSDTFCDRHSVTIESSVSHRQSEFVYCFLQTRTPLPIAPHDEAMDAKLAEEWGFCTSEWGFCLEMRAASMLRTCKESAALMEHAYGIAKAGDVWVRGWWESSSVSSKYKQAWKVADTP